jgi:hypothetical protein
VYGPGAPFAVCAVDVATATGLCSTATTTARATAEEAGENNGQATRRTAVHQHLTRIQGLRRTWTATSCPIRKRTVDRSSRGAREWGWHADRQAPPFVRSSSLDVHRATSRFHLRKIRGRRMPDSLSLAGDGCLLSGARARSLLDGCWPPCRSPTDYRHSRPAPSFCGVSIYTLLLVTSQWADETALVVAHTIQSKIRSLLRVRMSRREPDIEKGMSAFARHDITTLREALYCLVAVLNGRPGNDVRGLKRGYT